MKSTFLVLPVATLLLTAAIPALARTHKEAFTVPCSTLWPAVKDTLRNSGKYGIIGISNDEMTASYNIGGSLTAKRVNSVLLNTTPTGCEMQVQTAYSGILNKDEADFKARVDASLTKLQSATPLPAAKPIPSPATPPPAPQN
jgi:outer membrane biogenesis lipoprotein LolB